MSKAQQDIRRKTRVLEHAERTGNVRQTCRYFGLPRSLFYVWKAADERDFAAGLVNKKPCAHTHPKATARPSSTKSRTCGGRIILGPPAPPPPRAQGAVPVQLSCHR